MKRDDIAAVEEIVGVRFHNKELLIQALTHRSYLNEHRKEGGKHNEILEFLGDAVLDLVVTEYLVRNVKGQTEGHLSMLRGKLVENEALNKLAKSLGIMRYWRASKGEKKGVSERGFDRHRHGANTVEAIIAAIYLDRGKIAAETFILTTVVSYLEEITDPNDPKSKLQEIVQEREGYTPEYQVLNSWGPDHDANYEVGVFVNKRLLAKGEGLSKKEASVAAAKNALEQLCT